MLSDPNGEDSEWERNKRLIFPFLILTLLIVALDNQIFATAMPTIVGDLGEAQHFSWLISAYILAQCAVMPIYGKLGDQFGRKRVTVSALFIFIIGAFACSLSWSMWSLIASRAFQGIGTGGLMVSVFSICADVYEPGARAKYQGYLSLTFLFGSCIGPSLGGFLTEEFGWRSIFLTTAPVGLAAMIGIIKLLPNQNYITKRTIDYAGAFLLAAIVSMIVLWVDSNKLFGSFLSLNSVLLGLVIVVTGCLWVVIERKSPEPIIPLHLLTNQRFALLALATMCCGAVAIGLTNFFAYFLQTVIALSPTRAGLFFIALTLGVSVGAVVAGRLMAGGWHFIKLIRLSLFMSMCALIIMSSLHNATPLLVVFAVFFLKGAAIGLSMNATLLGAQVIAKQGDLGAATGSISLTRMMGAAAGIAIYGTIISAGLSGMDLPGNSGVEGMTPADLQALEPQLYAKALAVFSETFSTLFRVAAAIALVGFLVALWFRGE